MDHRSPGRLERARERARQSWAARTPKQRLALAADALVLVATVVFVLAQLHPALLFANTTPSGGDMGAHVWGPAYLRDHLLPHGRLSGWTPDWYAGFPAYQFYMVLPSLLIVLLDVVLPYGVAFKLISVSGLLALPVAAYAFGRLADLRFPSPALLAVATVPFLFNRQPTLNNTGNIIGGNVASTLAGEFAFSISLALAVVYLGVLVRGLRTGRHRAVAAVLLGLTALCHVIPAIFAAVSTLVLLAVWPARGRLRWVASVAPVAACVCAFWALPFVVRHNYFNDMGWTKLEGNIDYLSPTSLRWVLALALVGAVLSFLYRLPAGIFLTLDALVFAAGFEWLPQGFLWNARLLPFFLLCVFLLAGLAVAEVGRAIATLVAADPRRPAFGVTVLTPIAALLATFAYVGLPLGVLPFEQRAADGGYRWLGFTVSQSDRNVVRDWARWNYTGYERKAAYPEYHDLVATMAGIGADPDFGCGRAFWEYENDRLNTYGTPMAPMLLPFWTDGCIGSMEGLYFESSATTPYHFLTQAELSTKPSSAQRDLKYGTFDIDLGVRHLQLLGVRYYLAFTEQAVRAAQHHDDLTEIATSGPWHVFEVAGADLVVPLDFEPVVVDGEGATNGEWIDEVGQPFYLEPASWDVPLAASGPDNWPRVPVGGEPPREAVADATVTNIATGDDRISFDVDEPGVPVLVKTSFFPNWKASGADGPWRVAPNLMVVVPTSNHVELRYGSTLVDYGGWLLTLVGIAGVVLLARRPPLAMPDDHGPIGYFDEDDLDDDDDDVEADGDDAGWGEPGDDVLPALVPEAPPAPAGPGPGVEPARLTSGVPRADE